MKIHNFKYCSPRLRAPTGAVVVNVTSVSTDFGKKFSPILCDEGPIELAGLTAHNVENIYQYTKCYSEHASDPKAWKVWRDNGLKKRQGIRYPMEKGRAPEFSYLTKELGKLDRIGARREIYIPAYRQKLDRYCQQQINTLCDMLTVTDVYLWDFDVRDIGERTFEEMMCDESASLGHGFVIAKYVADIIKEKTGIEIWK